MTENKFKCLPDCGHCCGNIIVPRELFEKHKDKAQVKIKEEVWIKDVVSLLTEDCFCIWLDRKTKQCVIYDDRPEKCRLYGLIPKLECPYLKSNGRRRSPAMQKRTQRKIDKMVNHALKSTKKQQKEII